MKVKEFLDLLLPKGIELIAGEKGLDRTITGINMMDNPDTIKWLKKGEFLITSGYLLKDDIEAQKKAIIDLAHIKSSGMGIKRHRYINEISQEVLDTANEYSVPIILIPYEYTLSDVSNVFYKEIYNRQNVIIQKSLYIHESLTSIVINGGSIKEVTSEVSKLIGNPVIVFDEYKNPVVIEQSVYDFKENQKFFNEQFFKEVKDKIKESNESVKYVYREDSKEVIFRVKPVIADKRFFGYIVVPEINKKLDASDYRVIERASEVIVLEMIKLRAIEETKELIRRDFFDDLLENRITSQKDIESLAGIHGLQTKYIYSCMVIEIVSKNEQSGGYYHEKELMLSIKNSVSRLIDQVAADERINVVTITRGNYIICFIPLHRDMKWSSCKGFTLEFAQSLEEKVSKGIVKYQMVAGIGKAFSIIRLPQSFREALEAMKLVNKLNGSKKIAHFEDFMLYHVLNSVSDKEVIKDFYNHTIEPLEQYDKANNSNLVETLEVYFKSKGNMSEASKLMYVHRNTFIYRIEKIKEILHIDFEDSEKLLELQLGIRIKNLVELYK